MPSRIAQSQPYDMRGERCSPVSDRVRECDCPEYVSRCSHYEGQRVWLITVADSRAELERRGAAYGKPCPQCGRPWTSHPLPGWAVVVGPGWLEESRCVCLMGLDVRGTADFDEDPQAEPLAAAEQRFGEVAAAMVAP